MLGYVSAILYSPKTRLVKTKLDLWSVTIVNLSAITAEKLRALNMLLLQLNLASLHKCKYTMSIEVVSSKCNYFAFSMETHCALRRSTNMTHGSQ